MMVTIEKGIPLPTRAGEGRPSVSIYRQMAVGDSVFLPNCLMNRRSNNWQRIARENGWKFTARTIDGGIRVWRVK